MTDEADRLYVDRLADLAVRLGANVQPGQIVAVSSEMGKEEIHRAVAVAAYRAGARFVDVSIFDPFVKRARALNADPDTLGFVPPWIGERVLALGEHGSAWVSLAGSAAPHALDGIDPALIGRDRLPRVAESLVVTNARTSNWTIVPAPNPGWAAIVHPDLDPAAALERLWEEIAHVCRLDEPDPVAAWRERLAELRATAERLGALALDAVRLRGPGTDLTVGMLPGHRWLAADDTTVSGITHVGNLPTEEVFTTPDPDRVNGIVTATKPLFVNGTTVKGLRVRFAGGRAEEVEAEVGAEVVRALVARDEGAARLGEVALVDGAGRIDQLGTIFYDTLLDENAASHIALGQGLEWAVDDAAPVNQSSIHVDFMVGSREVTATGLRHDGSELTVLEDGRWRI